MPLQNAPSNGGPRQQPHGPVLPLKGIIKTEEPSSPPAQEQEDSPNNGDLLIGGGSENGFVVAADSASGGNFSSSGGGTNKSKGEDCEMMKGTEPLRIGLAKPTTAFHQRTSTPTATQRVSPRLGSPGLHHHDSFPPDLAEHRILYKIKRFLSTLVQFGMEINAETGDKVKELILNLVASTISINEFHQVLQEVTNFPLRPFVLPFLKSNIPLLIRDVTRIWGSLSNGGNHQPQKSLLQYIRSQPNLIFDLQWSQSSAEINDIFNSEVNLYAPNTGRKRRGSSSSSLEDSNDLLSPLKRTCKSGGSSSARRQPHWVYPQQQQWRSNDNFGLHGSINGVNGGSNASAAPLQSSNNAEADDEWKNIYVMLNCILGMVEKTKRALSILQQRNVSNKPPNPGQYSQSNPGSRSNFNNSPLYGNNSNPGNNASGGSSMSNNSFEIMGRYHPYYSQPVGEFLANTLRNTEDRVVEVRRRAEEAVNEVKRIALAELQRVVCFDERRPLDSVMGGERLKMEKLISETSNMRNKSGSFFINNDESKSEKEDGEGSSTSSSRQSNCWNCGRNASETCSGCNLARYCSQFCQLKDWESHHRICGLKTGLSNFITKPSSSSSLEESSVVPNNVLKDSSEEFSNGGKAFKNEKGRGDEIPDGGKKTDERKNNSPKN